jgi:hypothetical protein
MGSGKLISRAIKKYGIENFTKTILERFDTLDEMYAREKEIVNEDFLLRDDVYNLNIGGSGGWKFINDNEEIKTKKSLKYKGSGNPFYGKTHSTLTKQKLSILASKQWSGVKKTEEHRQKIREANTGVPFSEERKRKISESKRGKPSWNSGKVYDKVVCPHCGVIGSGSNMKRWHFENCKKKDSP